MLSGGVLKMCINTKYNSYHIPRYDVIKVFEISITLHYVSDIEILIKIYPLGSNWDTNIKYEFVF